LPPPDRVASGRGARADDLPAEACGLSQAEVAERRRLGQVNDVPATSTHSVPQILRANILTPFNALLGGLLAVILVVGPLQDALFGLVLIANSLTGIVQELRAKRALDHLTVVNAPKARVVRGGSIIEVPLAEVVLDDLLEVRSGDQVVVDAIVAESRGLEVDESLLTGESDPVAKADGDRTLSGSFVVAGDARIRAEQVGREAYAQRLTEEARKLTRVNSELRTGLDRIIRLVAWAMLPTAALLLYSQIFSNARVTNALRGTVAGVVGGPSSPHERRVRGRSGAAGTEKHTGAGAGGRGNPGARRRYLRGQDRHADVRRDLRRRGRSPARARREHLRPRSSCRRRSQPQRDAPGGA